MRRTTFLLATLLVFAALTSGAHAQSRVPIRGDRLSGFVLPVEPLAADIRLKALRGWAWDVDDTASVALMERFHERFRSGGDPVGALAEAQRQAIAAGRQGAVTLHPFFWAGFRVSAGLDY